MATATASASLRETNGHCTAAGFFFMFRADRAEVTLFARHHDSAPCNYCTCLDRSVSLTVLLPPALAVAPAASMRHDSSSSALRDTAQNMASNRGKLLDPTSGGLTPRQGVRLGDKPTCTYYSPLLCQCTFGPAAGDHCDFPTDSPRVSPNTSLER